MQLQRFQDVQQFYERVQDYLMSYEAHHSLLFSILHILLHHPERYPHPPYLATVEADGEIIAATMQTPPHKLVLSKMVDLQASQLIAQDLVPRATTLPGVLGLVPEAQAFVSAWQDLTQQPARLAFELRMHQLQTVQPIRPTPGHLRPATESDRPLLIQWNHDFMMEAFGTLEEDPAQTAAYQLSQKRIYIWQDQEPVAMINSRVSTPHGATIAPVYTPPKHRRQGYATAAVAALSQQLLDQGYRYCFLFTDLANPTSNHIYQLVGYQAIADCRSYSLVDD
jgi:uncharacterized protein